jgi:hypothetical protein
MLKTFALALLVCASVVGCSKPIKAKVNCQEHTLGFACNVTTEGGASKKVEVCWDIKVSCGDTKLDAKTCQEASGEGTASTVVPNNKFTGGSCKVGKITGIAVDNVTIKAL